MKTLQEKNKELAIQHWKYIEGLLDVSLIAEKDYDMDTVIAMVRYHYLTAWEHGSKHYAELLDGYNRDESRQAVENLKSMYAWCEKEKTDSCKNNNLIFSQDEVDQILAGVGGENK